MNTKCTEFLRANASEQWFETFRIKENENYLHELTGLSLLLRIDFTAKLRKFFWLYSMKDVKKFIEYVHEELQMETHELIVNNKLKLFYDIDLVLTQQELDDLIEFYSNLSKEKDLDIDDVSRHIAYLYYEATLASLEEKGNDLEELQNDSDFMYTTRNRLVNNEHKISIHIITNIVCTIDECKAIVEDTKTNVLDDPSGYGLEAPEDHMQKIVDSIDVQPYHRHGSLALPNGCKVIDGVVYKSEIQKKFRWKNEENFITIIDSIPNHVDLHEYNVKQTVSFNTGSVSTEFVNEVLPHLHLIPNYSTQYWSLESSRIKNTFMIMHRLAPSYCSNCNRNHDNDNTLLIIFNEPYGSASWKCMHNRVIKAKTFYRKEKEDTQEFDLVDEFIRNYPSRGEQKTKSKSIQKTFNKQSTDCTRPIKDISSREYEEPIIKQVIKKDEDWRIETNDSQESLCLDERYEEESGSTEATKAAVHEVCTLDEKQVDLEEQEYSDYSEEEEKECGTKILPKNETLDSEEYIEETNGYEETESTETKKERYTSGESDSKSKYNWSSRDNVCLPERSNLLQSNKLVDDDEIVSLDEIYEEECHDMNVPNKKIKDRNFDAADGVVHYTKNVFSF